jgi:hypothetical protein
MPEPASRLPALLRALFPLSRGKENLSQAQGRNSAISNNFNSFFTAHSFALEMAWI